MKTDDRFELTPSSSSEAFRALFAKAPDPMLLADDNRFYADANPAACAFFGLDHDELVGRSIHEFSRGPRAGTAEAWAAFIAAGQMAGETTIKTPDGMRQVEFTIVANVVPGRHLSILRDVTASDRQSTSAASAAQDGLTSMSDAFYMLDSDWRFTYLNPQSEILLRRTRGELLGTNIWAELSETVGSMLFDEYHRAVREQVTIEFEQQSPGLDAWFAIRACPTAGGLAVYYHDISAQRQLQAQLLQAQKLEAVGQLAGGVAHDFSNLLTVIDAYATLAQAKLDTEPLFVQKALREIASAGARAAVLTAKLLALGRKHVIIASAADLNDLVSSTLDLVAPLMGEQVRVHRLLEQDAGKVLVDVGQIEQVIINLAVNAKGAMRTGGNLYVATQTISEEAGELELTTSHYLRLTVRDDGAGMDEATQKKIFDPFFTTKPVGEGSGLGLSTAYATITHSGGRISVDSELGVGTTFTIDLPRCEPDAAAILAGPPPSTAGATERVLVVEDEEIVRSLVVEMLLSFGYDVVEAGSPAEALAACEGATFDLMFTDVVMPGGDGPTLARTILKRHPEMRILYTSGYTPQSIAHLDLEGNRTGFLSKPFSANELSEHVRSLLDLRDEVEPQFVALS